MRCYYAGLRETARRVPRGPTAEDFFSQNEISQHQHVHLRAPETIQSLFGAADDRLVVIERSIQHDRHAGEIADRAQKLPIERIGRAADGLQPRGAVHMRGRGNHGALFRAHRIGKGHERRGVRLLEKFAGGFFGDRGRKGAENLAVLDAAVENVLHFRAARIGQNAAIAQRARAPFRRALKPAHDFSVGDVARRSPRQSAVSSSCRDFRIRPEAAAPSTRLANLRR